MNSPVNASNSSHALGITANSAAIASGIVHVTRDDQLQDALSLLARSDYVALDTEFLRESTYFAKLCLVQLGNEHACVVVDVLALTSLTPLLDFILDRSRLKVLHAARQDLEVLVQAQAADQQQVPGPLFDTQVAAGLLGLPGQIGYGDLLTKQLGITLPKGQARTDWSRRPLSPEQLTYAADDVRYLGPLLQTLRAQLQQRDRLSWLEEEMLALDNLALYRTDADTAWLRLKGTAQLQPAQRAVLKQLASWREQRAVQADKPRGWILSDDALRHISERLPHSMEALERTRDLQPAVLRKHGEHLLALVQRGEALASNEPPARDFRPSNAEQKAVSRLMQVVRDVADGIQVSAELLATRRDVEQLVYFNKTEHLQRGWRKAQIGDELIATHQQS